MAAIGHVTIDSKEYMLKALPSAVLANQMASKISSGESEYSSLDSWSNWVTDTWQAGVGRTKPHLGGGGYLWGEVDTKVPNQMILPLALDSHVTDAVVTLNPPFSATTYSTLTVGSGGVAKAAVNLSPTGAGRSVEFAIYAIIPTAVNVQMDLYTAGSTTPSGAVITSVVASSIGGNPYPQWHKFSLAYTYAAGELWLSIAPASGSITLVCNNNASIKGATYDGAAWSTSATPMLVSGRAYRPSTNTYSAVGMVDDPTHGLIVAYNDNGTARIYKHDTVNNDFDLVDSLAANTPVDLVTFGGVSYSATGTNIIEWATGAALGVSAQRLWVANGYLWKSSSSNILAYCSDPTSTWTLVGANGDGVVGHDSYSIRSVCGMGEDVYVAMDDGLYRVAPGDFVLAAAPFPTPYSGNGASMVNFQGALYLTVLGRVWRYSADGTLQDVWISRDDDLPSSKLGPVGALATSSAGVVALVNAESSTGNPSVWLYTGNAWHHILTLPYGMQAGCYYSRTNSRLYVYAAQTGVVCSVKISDFAINPYNDTTIRYMPYGWIEWDWYFSNIRENPKDWESLVAWGDLAANQNIKVYYKLSGSTTWTLLGTCDSDGEELFWAIPRTATRSIKLGILLSTTTYMSTPRVMGLRLKHMIMVKDWFRYSLLVDVSGGLNGAPKQEMLNGERNPYSATQIKANLDALATQDTPFTFSDLDGSQYLVKMQAASFQYTKVEYNNQSSSKEWEGAYSVTLEAVRSGTYP